MVQFTGNCERLVQSGDLFDWSKDFDLMQIGSKVKVRWTTIVPLLQHDPTVLQVDDIEMEHVCEPHAIMDPTLLPHLLSYNAHKELCHNFGGQLFFAEHLDHWTTSVGKDHHVDPVVWDQVCNKRAWTPIEQETGSNGQVHWRNSYDRSEFATNLVVQVVQSCLKLSKVVQSCPKLSKVVQSCPKLSKLSKLSKVVQSCPSCLSCPSCPRCPSRPYCFFQDKWSSWISSLGCRSTKWEAPSKVHLWTTQRHQHWKRRCGVLGS